MGAWVLTFDSAETPPPRPILSFQQLSLMVYHRQAEYLRTKIYKLSKEISRFAKQNPTKPPIPMDKLIAAEERLEEIETKIVNIMIRRQEVWEEEDEMTNAHNILQGIDPQDFPTT